MDRIIGLLQTEPTLITGGLFLVDDGLGIIGNIIGVREFGDGVIAVIRRHGEKADPRRQIAKGNGIGGHLAHVTNVGVRISGFFAPVDFIARQVAFGVGLPSQGNAPHSPGYR